MFIPLVNVLQINCKSFLGGRLESIDISLHGVNSCFHACNTALVVIGSSFERGNVGLKRLDGTIKGSDLRGCVRILLFSGLPLVIDLLLELLVRLGERCNLVVDLAAVSCNSGLQVRQRGLLELAQTLLDCAEVALDLTDLRVDTLTLQVGLLKIISSRLETFLKLSDLTPDLLQLDVDIADGLVLRSGQLLKLSNLLCVLSQLDLDAGAFLFMVHRQMNTLRLQVVLHVFKLYVEVLDVLLLHKHETSQCQRVKQQ